MRRPMILRSPAIAAAHAEFLEEMQRRQREHEERMTSDPAYRAKIATQLAEEEMGQRAARLKRLLVAGVPEKFAKPILGGASEKSACLDRAEAFLSSSDRTLVLSGAPGCGKSHAASFVVARSLDVCHLHGDTSGDELGHAVYRRMADVAQLEKFGRYQADDLRALERGCLLVLDDLGVEVVDERLLSAIDGIVDARYAAGRRTVMTTNLEPSRFRQRYGERVYDRIRESGAIFVSTEPSRRGRAR
jgi:DNA replication protein DnaC